jgi:hypothetical protein
VECRHPDPERFRRTVADGPGSTGILRIVSGMQSWEGAFGPLLHVGVRIAGLNYRGRPVRLIRRVILSASPCLSRTAVRVATAKETFEAMVRGPVAEALHELGFTGTFRSFSLRSGDYKGIVEFKKSRFSTAEEIPSYWCLELTHVDGHGRSICSDRRVAQFAGNARGRDTEPDIQLSPWSNRPSGI